MQASLFYKTNKYFHINKNDTGYHKALSLSLSLTRWCARKLRSTAKQMPALVVHWPSHNFRKKISTQSYGFDCQRQPCKNLQRS
jgi:hypothetical protein